MTALRCAILDLARDWVYFLCNVALVFGVVVPLLVLIGVKGGFYSAMLDDLLHDPATLRIDTVGNIEISPSDIDALRDEPGVQFAVGRTRSFFDAVNVRRSDGGPIRDAVILPTGAGDPLLPPELQGAGIAPTEVVVSQGLAERLELTIGDGVQLVTQSESRPRQLLMKKTVAGVLPPAAFSGRTLFVHADVAEQVEAFYEGFSVPSEGVNDGKDLDSRSLAMESLRVHAHDLSDVGPVQTQIEARFGVDTRAATNRIARTLALGRGLNLALGFIAGVAGIGLLAALSFAFWADVARKRDTLAVLALIGMPKWQISMVPLLQAILTGVAGMGLSFAGYAAASMVMQGLFPNAVPAGRSLTVMPAGMAAILFFGVICGVALVSGLAAWRAAGVSPSHVLRSMRT